MYLTDPGKLMGGVIKREAQIMKFHLAINMERLDASMDMNNVARHTLEMVQMEDFRLKANRNLDR
jgi:hypothetical protein